MQDWMTMQEVAAYLGVTKRTVQQWVKDGQLDVLRVTSRTVRISRQMLETFLLKKVGA